MRAALLLPLLVLARCAPPAPASRLAPAPRAAPSRPAGCQQVPVGADLQGLVDHAAAGQALCLSAGSYNGPLRLERGVILHGPREALIRSTGAGTTVLLRGRGAQLLGVTVDGSGHRYDQMDAALQVEAGEDIRVEGVRLQRAVFGLLVNRSHRVLLRGNEIVGTEEAALGLRGDGLRLWETTDADIEDNFVEHSRDLVLRYSRRVRLRNNTITGCRYGLHLMYSSEVQLEDNRSVGNVVGTFIMYSREVLLRRNLLAAASGAAGIGLGIKESGDITAEDNQLIANAVGAYLDSTPLRVDEHNRFARNAFRLGDVGIIFHSSQRRNRFEANSLRDNLEQVRVEGGGDALGVDWEGNDFDDYQGFDLDGDGVGDVPYSLRSLSGQLIARFPSLGFFRGTPALSLVDALSQILPLFQPRPLLTDARPSALRLEPAAALRVDHAR